MEALVSGLLVACLLTCCRCQSEMSQQGFWRMVFTLDVVAPGASVSTAARSKLDCARHCSLLEDCKTSAFHQHSATCWLYPHLVEYGTTGMASPGTRYFWRLSPSCPGELGYQLDAGICLKVYTTAMTWTISEETCRKDGGHLLIADTAEKRYAVLQKAGRAVWLGASDKDKEGEWRWSNGALMTTDSWGPGEPNNVGNSEHFLQMFPTGLFNDYSAHDNNAPACQIPLQ